MPVTDDPGEIARILLGEGLPGEFPFTNSIYRETPGSDAMRPTQRTPIPNLALAGDYTRQDYMASMEGAVRSGHRVAGVLLTGLKGDTMTHTSNSQGKRRNHRGTKNTKVLRSRV